LYEFTKDQKVNIYNKYGEKGLPSLVMWYKIDGDKLTVPKHSRQSGEKWVEIGTEYLVIKTLNDTTLILERLEGLGKKVEFKRTTKAKGEADLLLLRSLKSGKVHGTIRFEGHPLESGVIKFIPKDKKIEVTDGLIENGQYSVVVPVGLMEVLIHDRKLK